MQLSSVPHSCSSVESSGLTGTTTCPVSQKTFCCSVLFLPAPPSRPRRNLRLFLEATACHSSSFSQRATLMHRTPLCVHASQSSNLTQAYWSFPAHFFLLFSSVKSPDESSSLPPSLSSWSPPFPSVPKSMSARPVEFIIIQLFAFRFTDMCVAGPSLSSSTNLLLNRLGEVTVVLLVCVLLVLSYQLLQHLYRAARLRKGNPCAIAQVRTPYAACSMRSLRLCVVRFSPVDAASHLCD